MALPYSNTQQTTGQGNDLRRFIITGAPGSGKTVIIRQLELDGFSVVEEAAADVIAVAQDRGTAEPSTSPSFTDAVVDLQKQRQIRASYQPGNVQFHDRSVVCTAPLAIFHGYPISVFLRNELERVKLQGIYESRIFLGNLGFITLTDAREGQLRGDHAF